MGSVTVNHCDIFKKKTARTMTIKKYRITVEEIVPPSLLDDDATTALAFDPIEKDMCLAGFKRCKRFLVRGTTPPTPRAPKED